MTNEFGRYFFLGLGLTFTGTATAIVSYFQAHVIPFAALGVAIVILGVASVSLPDQVKASGAMKALLQGSTLGIDPLLDEIGERMRRRTQMARVAASSSSSADWRDALSDAEGPEPEGVGRGEEERDGENRRSIGAVYLPPDPRRSLDSGDYEGEASVYIPLNNQALPVTLEEMRAAPLTLLDERNTQAGIRVFTAGAYLGQVPEIRGEDTSIEEALQHLLVDYAELCSLVRASEIEDTIVVEINDVKLRPESRNYRDFLGSLPTSLAASLVCVMKDAPVMVADEEVTPAKTVARLSILRFRSP